MGLAIEFARHSAGPVLLCDACGARLAGARDGVVAWDEIDARPGTMRRAFLFHGACLPSADEPRQSARLPLAALLPYLALDLRLSRKDWQEATQGQG